jgi:apolipoprotein N-acyltransferase
VIATSLRRSVLLRCFVAVAIGYMMSLAQAPTSFFPAAVVGPAIAIIVAFCASTAAGAALVGWIFGLGYFLPGLLWIGEAFLVDADRFGWMRPIAVTILPAGLSLFWAIAFWLARRISLCRKASDSFAVFTILLIVFLSVAEFARGHVLTGFPWGLLSYAWVDTPVAQIAAYSGPYGLFLLTLCSAGLFACALMGDSAWPKRIAGMVASIAILGAMWAIGDNRKQDITVSSAAPLLRLVQPNILQAEKWAPEFRSRNYGRLVGLSAGDGQSDIDLVIWPETALPVFMDAAPDIAAQISEALPRDARLVLGSLRSQARVAGGADVFNSLMVFDAEGALEQVYDKVHLVPFGEYVPFAKLLAALGVQQLTGRIEGFAAGEKHRRIILSEQISFQPLICYEVIFPHERLSVVERPRFLLQITNDAWFGSSAGPWQHLAQSRFRAIEQGLPLIRSANTGVSASIDAYGNVVASLALLTMGAIDIRLPRALPPTPYVSFGETGFAIFLALLGFVVGALWRRPT